MAQQVARGCCLTPASRPTDLLRETQPGTAPLELRKKAAVQTGCKQQAQFHEGFRSRAACLSATAVVGAFLLPEASTAAAIHAEPENALSLPTWIIHISSVIEWGTAMALMWRYADVTGDLAPRVPAAGCCSLSQSLISRVRLQGTN